MKKLISLALALIMVFALVACSNKTNDSVGSNDADTTVSDNTQNETPSTPSEVPSEEPKPESISIKAMNANKELTEVEVPYDPQRLCVLDMACLDYIDNLGLGDRIVGGASTSIEYLLKYVPGEGNDIANCGTIKTPDLEAIMECEPDVIFIGGRLSSFYDQLTEIAPVVYLPGSDNYTGVVEMTGENAKILASMFGMEEQIDALLTDYNARIEALKAVSEGKTAIVGICTGGSFNVLGNDGRCSIIGKELGWENIGVDANIDTSTHGNEASFEFIVEKNPDYIFVMDRDKAIQTEGAQLAKDIMENELVMSTDCYKNGNLIIMDNPNVWYTAEGGVTALGVMLSDLETALGLK